MPEREPEPKPFDWLFGFDCSTYGENEYAVLRRTSVGAYAPAQVLTIGGGTGKHSEAVRAFIDGQPGAYVGERHWAVIGPAHDGQKRLVLLRTDAEVVYDVENDSADPATTTVLR
jgi:hypothetical protein